jgi:hypothetical protein
MKTYWRYSRDKMVHDWEHASRETFMASVCKAHKEKRPEDLLTDIAGKPQCKHCERMGNS